MNDLSDSTGYGPSMAAGRFGRLIFDGDERKYESWEVKFLGYMRLRKLKDTILPPSTDAEIDADKNAEAFAELIQFLDDKSLSLVMRDAMDNGKKALEILRQHYAGSGKPRIISLYTELTSLTKRSDESVTDYVIRAETAAAALNNANENVSDSLLIAMVLKGLPQSFKPFVVVVTQSDKQQTFTEFKAALRSFEDTDRNRTVTSDDSVMKTKTVGASGGSRDIVCYKCKQVGHIARFCESKSKLWCSFCRKSNHTDSTCRSKGKARKASKDKAHVVTTAADAEEQLQFAFKVSSESRDVSATRPGALLVDCGATAHIVTDKSRFTSFDESFRPEKHYIELANGSKSNVALARGDVTVRIKDSHGRYVSAALKDALYVPSFPQSIFSVQAATAKGSRVIFERDNAQLVYSDDTVFDIQKHGKLFYLDVFDDNAMISDSVNYACDLSSWHEILGHCNYDDVLKLQVVVNGMKVIGSTEKPADCNVCVLGKMTQGRSRTPRCRSTVPLSLVHTDLAGPIEPASPEGFRYAIVFTDDYSGVVFVYFLKSKSDAVEATERFLADSAPFGKVKCLRSDNGTEYTSQAYKSLLKRHCIRHEMSAPYSPHQNGTAERHWRTLFEMGRCLLMQANLAKEFWPYAVLTVAYIRNRCYSCRLEQTPYFALTGRKPDLSNMRVFGSECYAYKQDKRKLDARCTKGIFLGYDRGSPAYLVYFPDTGKVMKHRVVKFLKSNRCVREQQTQTGMLYNEDDDFVIGDNSTNDVEQPVEEPRESVPVQGDFMSEPVAGRYPRRERKPPAHLADYATGHDFENDNDDDQVMFTIDYCYKVCAFPQNYKEAIESPESLHWKNAMKEEMNSLKENNTFTLTTLPEGRKLVGGRWVYTVKENPNGSKTYKARYVAKGYSQVKNVDYQETFAPTANFTSVRTVMQLAAQNDLILHQMDVKTAYLNAPIDCEIYMEQPEGFAVPSNSEDVLVCKLNKSLYGLKQSGRNWNGMLHSYLYENSFVQ